jgi:hypothetical protein
MKETDVERVLETLHWKKTDDARSLRTDLCRKLNAPGEEIRLMLRPDGQDGRPLRYDVWHARTDLPVCRLVWVGDIVASPFRSRVPALEVLVEPGMSLGAIGAFQQLIVPITALRLLSIARVLKDSQPCEIRAKSHYGEPGPRIYFAAHMWDISCWVDRAQTAVMLPEEIPALRLATLTAHPHFANTPLCIFADRPARRLLIVPCWEILR